MEMEFDCVDCTSIYSLCIGNCEISGGAKAAASRLYKGFGTASQRTQHPDGRND